MIIVAGSILVKPEAHDTAVAAFLKMAAETLKEDGCIIYEFFASLDTPGTFHVYEHWETKEALAAHGKTAHMGELRATMKDIAVAGGSVRRFEATEFDQF